MGPGVYGMEGWWGKGVGMRRDVRACSACMQHGCYRTGRHGKYSWSTVVKARKHGWLHVYR